MQNHYNLIYREEEREMMKLCADQKIAVIPWSPLARGKLTRSWDQQQTTERAGSDEFGKTLYKKTEEADKIIIDRVGEIAAAKGVPRAQVALAWMLSKPFITSPIIGATKQHHLDDAVGGVSVKLSAEEIARLEEPYVPHAISGFA
jgi:aryl-alcohol dehydrogenase-like predicted oxidoreductase